jgi:RNA polymerase sigma-70 factor (ECF subfamily)
MDKRQERMEKTLSLQITDFFNKERGRMKNFIKGRIADNAGADAEDIIQDVMVRLFEMADFNVPLEKLSSYIYTALRNRIVDMFRSRKPQVSLDEINEQEEFSLQSAIGISPAADVALENEEFKDQVYEAIERLDEDEQEVVIATEFEDITFKELSEMWDVPIGTLLSKKARSMQKIKNTLSKGGVENAK